MLTNHLQGIWGPVTATLDWCEANYYFSPYIAEMANTTSNLFSIWIALHGVLASYREGLSDRYTFAFAQFVLVGLGSFAFHATLLYEAQLADELPMIYGVSYGLFLLFDTENGYGVRSVRSKAILASTVLFNVFFTWSYAVLRNPIYHQVVFATLILTAAARTMYLLDKSKKSGLILTNTRSEISKVFITGAVTFAFGFFVWNLDNIFCNTLTRWKVAIDWPLAFFFECHAWWHILTGLGSYLMIVGVTYLCLCVKDDYRNYALEYTSYGLPHVKVVPEFDRDQEEKQIR